MAMQKGSRVRCVKRDCTDPVQIGDIGTVNDESGYTPNVIWDVRRCGMHGDKENEWCMNNYELVEIDDENN